MPAEVEYEERELPPVQVPATNDGVRYELRSLRYSDQGEKYVHLTGHNGSDYRVLFLDETGRRFPVASGQPFDFDLAPGPRDPGVNYVAVQPDGGNITAGQVTLIATVRRPRLAHG